MPEEGRPGTLLAREAEAAVEQAIGEPFEADGNIDQPAAELRGDTIDHGAADDCLADPCHAAPAGAVRE